MKKDDSNEPLTKGEFRTFEKRMFKTETKIDTLEARFDRIESQMVTKDDWNKHMTMMDAMMAEIEASREERIFFEK